MGSRPTALYYLVKWLVLPCGMAALGYFAIAPRVSGSVLNAKSNEAKQAATPEPKVTEPSSEAPSATPSAGPEVDVEVAPAKPRATTKSKKRKKKALPKAAEPAATPEKGEETPPVATPPGAAPPQGDPAGSGGLTDGGEGATPPALVPDPVHHPVDTERVRLP